MLRLDRIRCSIQLGRIRNRQQRHRCLLWRAPALARIAVETCGDDVFPRIAAALGQRDDVVTRQLLAREIAAAVQAQVLVAREERDVGQGWAWDPAHARAHVPAPRRSDAAPGRSARRSCARCRHGCSGRGRRGSRPRRRARTGRSHPANSSSRVRGHVRPATAGGRRPGAGRAAGCLRCRRRRADSALPARTRRVVALSVSIGNQAYTLRPVYSQGA